MMDDKRMQRKRDLRYKVQSNNNSSMAQDLDEMKKLGKEMEQAPTDTELARGKSNARSKAIINKSKKRPFHRVVTIFSNLRKPTNCRGLRRNTKT